MGGDQGVPGDGVSLRNFVEQLAGIYGAVASGVGSEDIVPGVRVGGGSGFYQAGVGFGRGGA